MNSDYLINDSLGLVMVLLTIPAILFYLENHPKYGKIFNVIPVLVFAYFVPTALTALNVIPPHAEVYKVIKSVILPAALLLLTLSVDLPSVLKLGPKALVLFFAGTLGIVIGGPISLFLFQDHLPPEIWKGMAALAGSWIGGGANFLAVGQAVGATETMIGMMVIVDVGVASFWTGALMYFAGRYQSIDKRLKADNSSIEHLKDKVTKFQEQTARIAVTKDYMMLFALTFGATWIAIKAGEVLPEIGDVISHSTWKVILITTFGLVLSFTPAKNLEGVGASKFGTLFLYMLIGVIGASADLKEMVKYPALLGMGGVWILIHIVMITVTMRLMRAPLFYMAVGSQANIGAAASAPIVASAFHPSLATVGVLLGVFGYVVGTYAALMCAGLLQWISLT